MRRCSVAACRRVPLRACLAGGAPRSYWACTVRYGTTGAHRLERQPSVWLVRAHWCTVSFVRLACALTTRLAPFQARVHGCTQRPAGSGMRFGALMHFGVQDVHRAGILTVHVPSKIRPPELTKEADGRPWTPPYPSRRAPRSRKSMPGCATISKPCTRPWENHREQQQQSQELLKHRRPLPTATQAWCRRCQQSRCQQQAPRCHRSLRTTL